MHNYPYYKRLGKRLGKRLTTKGDSFMISQILETTKTKEIDATLNLSNQRVKTVDNRGNSIYFDKFQNLTVHNTRIEADGEIYGEIEMQDIDNRWKTVIFNRNLTIWEFYKNQ